MPAAFLIPLLKIVAEVAISFAITAISQSIQKKKSKGDRQSYNADNRQQQNITSNIAYLPVVYGKARVGGNRVYCEVKQAYAGEEQQGNTIMQTRGDYLYNVTALCEGEVESIEDVLIDNISMFNSKFDTKWAVDVHLSWQSFSEPVSSNGGNSQNVNTVYGNAFYHSLFQTPNAQIGNTFSGYFRRRNHLGVLVWSYYDENGQIQNAPNNMYPTGNYWKNRLISTTNNTIIAKKRTRYRIFRKDLSVANSPERLLLEKPEGTKAVILNNTDYGHWLYRVEYITDNGLPLTVGYVDTNITKNNDDHDVVTNDVLEVAQNSYIKSEYIQYAERLGKTTQTIPQFLIDEAPNYLTTSIGVNVCYIAHRLLKHSGGVRGDNNPFSQVPNITAIVKGTKVLDPRTNIIDWTDNPACCILDYLTNTRYGFGLDISVIDLQSFIDSANYCDDIVSNPDNTTGKRYTLNGVVDTSATLIDNLEQLLLSCAGNVSWTAGKWSLKLDKPLSSIYSFDPSNISAENPLEFAMIDIRNKQNALKIRYVNPSIDYQLDMTAVNSPVYKLQDKGRLLERELELPFTTDKQIATRLAMLALKKSRVRMQCKFRALIGSLDVASGDVVDITYPAFNWVNKLFKINKIDLTSEGELDYECEEYDPLVYDVDDFGLTSAFAGTNLPIPSDVQPPTNATEVEGFDADYSGALIPAITISWDRSISPDIKEYQLEYRTYGLAEWTVAGKVQENQIKLYSLPLGDYEMRIKAINVLGRQSAYLEDSFSVVGANQVPSNVLAFVIKQSTEQHIFLEWSQVPEVLHSGGYRIKHINKTTGATWQDIATFEMLLTGRDTGATLPALNGTYLIKAVNIAGRESTIPAEVVLIRDDAGDYILLTEYKPHLPAIDWAGTYTNLIKDSATTPYSTIILDGVEFFDNGVGLFDSAGANFDDLGGYALVGVLEHANYVDLGLVVQNAKLTKDIVAHSGNVALYFDSQTGLFDDQTSILFDSGTDNQSIIKVYYQTTSDDPSLSPVWSTWQELTENIETFRAVRFRTEIFSTNLYNQTYLKQLTIKILSKRRTEQRNINVAGASYLSNGYMDINFNTAFYNIPSVNVYISNGTSGGEYAVVTNVTTTGFRISVYNNSNTLIQRQISYIATQATI